MPNQNEGVPAIPPIPPKETPTQVSYMTDLEIHYGDSAVPYIPTTAMTLPDFFLSLAAMFESPEYESRSEKNPNNRLSFEMIMNNCTVFASELGWDIANAKWGG